MSACKRLRITYKLRCVGLTCLMFTYSKSMQLMYVEVSFIMLLQVILDNLNAFQ